MLAIKVERFRPELTSASSSCPLGGSPKVGSKSKPELVDATRYADTAKAKASLVAIVKLFALPIQRCSSPPGVAAALLGEAELFETAAVATLGELAVFGAVGALVPCDLEVFEGVGALVVSVFAGPPADPALEMEGDVC